MAVFAHGRNFTSDLSLGNRKLLLVHPLQFFFKYSHTAKNAAALPMINPSGPVQSGVFLMALEQRNPVIPPAIMNTSQNGR